jgi:glycosyltransferase involved in cell wall biosynthesis
MTSARPALIVAIHDGFYGHGTGAGRSNRAFLRVLCDLILPCVQLTVMPIRIAPGSAEYDAAWHRETLGILDRAAGHAAPLDNGTGGRTRFGGLGNFRQASASGAARITPILDNAAQALVVAFDAPFYGLAPLLPARHAARIVNVARATAALHAPSDHERVRWERDGLLATARAGGHIAATSRHIRQHLADAYGIPPAAITDLINGLVAGEAAPRPGHDGGSLLPPAASRGFLLSYGRAEPYKGFHDLLDSLIILREAGTPVPHLVLGAVTDGPPRTRYQQRLARRIEADNLDVTLHTTFSPRFRELLAHPRLSAVIVPSRAEPFGRIPLEAYQAGASPVVATTAGGLAEIVTDGSTGYTANPGNPYSLAAAIIRALTTTPERRRQLLARGRDLAAASFDYKASTAAFLAAAAPWATRNGQST